MVLRERLKLDQLQPFLSFKEYDHACQNGEHDAPNEKIPISPFEFWHIFEIHSVYPCNESERNKNGGYSGKHFHGLIHLLTER